MVPRSGVTRYTPENVRVPLLGRGGTGPRVGEVDAAVGLDHDVVGPVELPSVANADRRRKVEAQD